MFYSCVCQSFLFNIRKPCHTKTLIEVPNHNFSFLESRFKKIRFIYRLSIDLATSIGLSLVSDIFNLLSWDKADSWNPIRLLEGDWTAWCIIWMPYSYVWTTFGHVLWHGADSIQTDFRREFLCSIFFCLNIFFLDIETDESEKQPLLRLSSGLSSSSFFGLGAKAGVICQNGKIVCDNWMDTACIGQVHLVQWTSFAYWSESSHLHCNQYNIFSFWQMICSCIMAVSFR